MKKQKQASRKRMQSRNNRYQKVGPGVQQRLNAEGEPVYVGNRAMRRKEVSKNRKKKWAEASIQLAKELSDAS